MYNLVFAFLFFLICFQTSLKFVLTLVRYDVLLKKQKMLNPLRTGCAIIFARQREPTSSANTRQPIQLELFKPSKDAQSLLISSRKKHW